ncbi:hypothetical protein SAMN02745191_1128 [Anaerorhabdus furcosa]|uniref:Uncharacterized protein n=2 Tax=Anaerorhabdus furcosa TaxID=118967 RepID=A0A1T4M0E5_9FIRM|nr:hypothetical protein SAMN02745191_1128 [Anaerorhabdus furcosa]
MDIKDIDLLLKSFKWHVKSYYSCSSKLLEINDLLQGGAKSPRFKDRNEAKYQKGTVIYTNNIPELLDEEEKTNKELKFHKFAIDKVHTLILNITFDDLKLIEKYYWYGMTHQKIADQMCLDVSVITKKINKIISNLHSCAMKIRL